MGFFCTIKNKQGNKYRHQHKLYLRVQCLLFEKCKKYKKVKCLYAEILIYAQ